MRLKSPGRVTHARPARPTALGAAVRDAARFDRSAVSVAAGVLAAIPVVTVFGIGVAASDRVAAATMGAGAMLVGIGWRVGGGRPPVALMATDAMVMALSTFVGAATGSISSLHLVVLFVWSLAAGLAVAVGRRGAVIGTQAIIAFVVFGRFSQPVPSALGLAGLVLAGGLAEVLFVALARWPPPLRVQRTALGRAYHELAKFAVAPEDTTAISAGLALDEAELTVSSPVLFGDESIMRLRSLVDEGRRIRLELNAIRTLLRQSRGMTGSRAHGLDTAPLETLLGQAAHGLGLAAAAIEGDTHAASELARAAAELSARADALRESATGKSSDGFDSSGAILLHVAQRVSALAGQMRAVAALVPATGRRERLLARRPLRGTQALGQRVRSDLAQMRANMSLDSPAGRHAVRLAVVVVGTELLSRHLPLQRSYWIVVAAATALRPEFGATFTRGAERILGTCVGVVIAGVIAVVLHPGLDATVPIIAVLAVSAYTGFPASFAAGFAFITALIVFLLEVVAPGTVTTASERLVDTLVGGAIGLLAYLVWPTWSRKPARQALADVIDAQRRYLDAILGSRTAGARVHESEVRPLARTSRLARTDAEAAVARSLAEPVSRRIDFHQSQAMLTGLRRLVEATQVLRLDAAHEESGRAPLPTLAPLAEGLDRALQSLETITRADDPGSAGAPARPQLRALYTSFENGPDAPRAGPIVLAELDEIVDAVNTLGSFAGLRESTLDQERRSQALG